MRAVAAVFVSFIAVVITVNQFLPAMRSRFRCASAE
jgi:hypothetical protein